MKKLTFLVLIGVLIAICLIAYRADQANRNNAASSSQMNLMAMAGTWKDDAGQLFQFREDGTARSRNPALTPSTVNYFKWSVDGSTLMVSYTPRGMLKGFIAERLGVDTYSCSITDLTDSGFTLGAELDEPTRFERTQDKILDSDP